MLVFGCALYGAWLARSGSSFNDASFLRLQRHAATWSFISATLMLAIQGGLMGSGWRDVISTDVWGAVLQTQFGGVWLWQIILALVTSGGGYYRAAQHAATAVNADDCAVYFAGWRRACDAGIVVVLLGNPAG